MLEIRANLLEEQIRNGRQRAHSNKDKAEENNAGAVIYTAWKCLWKIEKESSAESCDDSALNNAGNLLPRRVHEESDFPFKQGLDLM